MSGSRLLIVEDDASFLHVLAHAMSERGYTVAQAPNGTAALAWLAGNECDLMLLDLHLPDISGMEVLQRSRQQFPRVEVVVLTGNSAIDTAIRAIHLGAFHYLTKPCPTDELHLTLLKARERQEMLERTAILTAALAPPDLADNFVGVSSHHERLLRRISRVAASESSVLILGETGVGKELVAKLVHGQSERRACPFVPVDCASLHTGLLQSELFGHEKGAFTGAERRKHGLFEVADSGTIFLDEIGDISPSLQVQLLRVLESGTFRRVGGLKEHRVDVRVVAATNRKLDRLVERGHFREDLFYRLNTLRIDVAPLRERIDDISCLVGYYTGRYNQRFGGQKRFSPEALEILMGSPWPGNVRQLINTLEECLILTDSDVILPAQLPVDLRPRKPTVSADPFHADLVPLRELERHYIEFVVGRLGGHRAKVAKALGISERSLYRKLKQYSIE